MLRDIKRVKDRVLVLPTMAARPTAPESPDNPELARLVARASLLLSQGNIGAARIVLERAAETGSGLAPPLGAPTNTRRARRWLKILPVTACLVAAAAGWWHYRSEVVTVVEMTILPV